MGLLAVSKIVSILVCSIGITAALAGDAASQATSSRPLVSEVRLPWEHPRADGLLTPGQVHRRFTGILVRMGTPARAPRTRGKSPGRQTGCRPEPPLHYQVARRPPRRAA